MNKIFVNRLPIRTFGCNQIMKYCLKSLLPGFIFPEHKDEQLGILKLNKIFSWKPILNILLGSTEGILKQKQLWIAILTINCNNSSTNGSWTLSFAAAVLSLYPYCCLQYVPVQQWRWPKAFGLLHCIHDIYLDNH